MHQLWIIPALPLLGFLLNGLLGGRFGKAYVSFVGPSTIGIAFLHALYLFYHLLTSGQTRLEEHLYTWVNIGTLEIPVALQMDALSGLFTLVITGVGFLIHVYSIGYMKAEEGYYRFFAYLNLFVFFMLMLVLGDSMMMLFVGWEGVGLCSYLLIGYYFEKPSAAEACKKAIIVNRIGDFGFLSAMMILFVMFGSLNFQDINAQAAEVFTFGGTLVTVTTLLLFLACTAKSAQIPLYVWLPDAMEGPTPVSALIHAATMVTAGLYLIARMSHVFILAPITMHVVAIVGAMTALFAALIAISQMDIKKVLAYSTVSQLGYMFLAMGVGAFGAGVFHVMTHAFFKALLFLGAGSVIHALHHEQDMRFMGGLSRKLPFTFATMAVATLAITGIPPFAGFFSKDEILWKAFSSPLGHQALWGIGFVTALLTSFYMFRLLFFTFFGKNRMTAKEFSHVHESPWVMTVPLIVLAVFSALAGFLGMPHVFHVPNLMEQLFHGVFPDLSQYQQAHGAHAEATTEWILMGLSVAGALLSGGLAYQLYAGDLGRVNLLKGRLYRVWLISWNKFYIDEIYNFLIVRPMHRLSDQVLWRFSDTGVIDRLVLLTAQWAQTTGSLVRTIQNGVLQRYALYFTGGSVMIIWYLIFY